MSHDQAQIDAVKDALARPAVYAGPAIPAFSPMERHREWMAIAVLNALAIANFHRQDV